MNLLGTILYDPTSAASKATSSLLAMTALDTTNLRQTITVPAHGKLRFHMRGIVTGATTTPTLLIGVMVASVVKGRVAPTYENATANAATQNFVFDADFTVTGLAAGSTVFDAAYAVQVVVASTNIKFGGPDNASGANAWGGFLFEIWDPQPISTNAQLVVDANGGVDVRTWRGGAIPAVNVTGVPIVDNKYLLGTVYATPATAGIVDVNVKNMNNVAATAITTINANMGSTQPVNFTGTAASALIKSDTVDWNGTAVAAPATAGIPEVNVKNINNVSASPVTTIKAVQGLATDGVIPTATNLTNLPSIPANWLTAAGIAAAALNGKGDWNIGKTGYALSAAGVQAIWDALTSALTTATSVGKLLVDNINATITSRMASYTQPTGFLAATFPGTVASPTNITAATGITVSTNSDKTGYALSSAGVQAVWDALTSALTTVGSIGKLLVTNIDALISSRSTFAGGAVASVTGNVGGNVTGSVGSLAAQAQTDVQTAMTGQGYTATRAGYLDTLNGLVAAIWGAATRTLSAFGFTVNTNANATETAIKAKTDSLTFTKAGEVDSNVQSVNDATVTGDGKSGTEWGPV